MRMRTRGLRGSGGNSGGNGRATGSGDSQLTDTAGGVFIANLPGVLAVMSVVHQAIPSVKVAVRAADRTDRHRVHGLAQHTIPPPRGGTSTRVPGKGAGWAHMYLAESRLGRHSRKMPTSDWESVRRLRGDALWKDADQVLLTRAMLRCGLAAGWVTLAALTISGGAWIGGLPMLQAWGLSLLTASHTVVLRVEGRLPRPLRRLFERLFVYPDQPHVNWVGI